MKIYPEMDKEIIKLLDMEGMPLSIYAARCIEKLQAENSRLTAEVAELRARLECSIEFPCKVGDTIYYINPYKEQPKIDEFRVRSLCKDNFYGKMIYIDNGEFFFAKTDGLFFTRAEAEARLKELKG